MESISFIFKIIVIGGITFVIYIAEKNYKVVQKTFKILEKTVDKIVGTEKPAVPEPLESKAETFQKEFDKIARSFEYLYEELYSTLRSNHKSYGEKELSSLITEWELKVKVNSAGPVQKTWNSLAERHFKKEWFADASGRKFDAQKAFLSDWYDELQKAGIKRDDRGKITVEDYSANNYYIINEIYKVGDQLTVERPCWLLNGKCIEKGIANVVSA